MNEAHSGQTITEVANPTPLLSSVISALSTDVTTFTGERFVFGSGVEIFYEHYHRYVFAARNISENQTVLDLGCGTGYGSLILASKAKKVIAFDRDQDSITLLNSLVKQLGVTNVEAVCGDVASLQSTITTPIDVVVCHELIEHLPRQLQESLLTWIASAKAPFLKETTFFVSTPERILYNQKNRSHNDYHECELTHADFKQLLSKHFKHVSLHWQGSITGNIIFSEVGHVRPTAANYVHWQNPTKLLGALSDTPELSGVYMYGVASNTELGTIHSSLLVDQRELLIMEKLSIAAQELNQTEQRLTTVREEKTALSCLQSLDRQAQQKIKDLMRENELLGARLENAHRQLEGCQKHLEDRTQHYETIIKTHIEAPLEVKLAKKCVEKMPNIIRKILRRCAAVGLALVRG